MWALLSPKALPAGYDLYHLNFYARKYAVQNATGPPCVFSEPNVSSWTAYQVHSTTQNRGKVAAHGC